MTFLGYVYFVQAEGGPIKIGYASDVAKRLSALQAGHYAPLVLLFTIEGGTALERRLHERFASARVRGEWFRADDAEVSAFVAAMLRDEPPSWLFPVDDADDYTPRCPRCGWRLEDELAERGAAECWTCSKESAS